MQHPLFWDWDITDDSQVIPFTTTPGWPSDDDDGAEDDASDYETPLDPWTEEAEEEYEGEDELNDEEDEWEDRQS